MIKYLKQYKDKTFEELVNGLIWFDLPFRLKAIFAKLAGERPYKAYTALLTQSSNTAPTAIILENELGNITFSRTGAGKYIISQDINFPFILGKTFILHTIGKTTEALGNGTTTKITSEQVTVDNSFSLTTTASNGTYSDGILNNCSVEIRVYN